MTQISNKIYCEDFLFDIDVPTKLLTNPYYDYPFLIIENFLSNSEIEELLAFIKQNQNSIYAKLREQDSEKLNTNIRKAKIYELNNHLQNIYDEAFLNHKEKIEKFFNLALTTSTKVQVLEYTKGFFYKAHSDDSSILVKDSKIVGFNCVAPKRKLTSVLFATSWSENTNIVENSFNGGELIFNYLFDENNNQVKYYPKAGDMILFLSNPFFTHEVLEVQNGYRLSLAQWHNAIV